MCANAQKSIKWPPKINLVVIFSFYSCLWNLFLNHRSKVTHFQISIVNPGDECAWSLIAQSVCQWAFSLLEIRFQRPSGFESCTQQGKQLVSFRIEIACLCQSIKINNNKYAEFWLRGVFEFQTPIKIMWTLISSDHEFYGPIVLTFARLGPISVTGILEHAITLKVKTGVLCWIQGRFHKPSDI